jgi:hypothetical protein
MKAYGGVEVCLYRLSLYPWKNTPRYSLYRRLGGAQSRSRRYGEDKNLLPMPGIETRFLDRRARILVPILTELSRHQTIKLYIVKR